MPTVFAGSDIACVRGERTVFRALDFRIESGGALVLSGPNGSGKSSLLRLMAGLGQPFSGRMTWNSEPVDDNAERHRARLRYVGHLDAIKPTLTVAENVAFWSTLAGGGRDTHERILAALATFGIGGIAHVPGSYLSAGQRRRVALSRLLAAPVTLWLLDEPRTALDADAVRRLDSAIARHRAAGGMVVLSLHDGPRPPASTALDLASFAVARQEAALC